MSEQDSQALRLISEQTGKSADELAHEAVTQLVHQLQQSGRLELLRQARGMWRDHNDLPELETLRAELNHR